VAVSSSLRKGAVYPEGGVVGEDELFRYRIEEAKFSLSFLFWWHYSRLRHAVRRSMRPWASPAPDVHD